MKTITYTCDKCGVEAPAEATDRWAQLELRDFQERRLSQPGLTYCQECTRQLVEWGEMSDWRFGGAI